MANRRLHIILGCVTMLLVTSSCVEPFQAESLSFENVLVIDARITDEQKRHEVILRRTYPFENENFEVERNASVQITDDTGNIFDFQEVTPGSYVSISEFSAQPNMGYRLLIMTSDGRSYESETAVTPKNNAIAEVKAEIGFNDEENEGLRISLTNESGTTNAKYFRYEYEETYKIVAPFYNPFEFDVIDSLYFQDGDNDGFEIDIKPRKDESQFCYGTQKGKDLILRDSEQNIENATGEFEIRFLENIDFKIAHRYSILVKQYTLSADSYSYYSTLNDFATDESVFTDIQPGFLEGNIKSSDDETVLGYFEIASVSNKRLFFDYEDFYPDSPLPPYIINCQLTTAPLLISFVPHVGPGFVVDESDIVSPLLDGIQAGLIAYHETNEAYELDPSFDGEVTGLGPFFVKATGCIDCREFGSNIKPDFWID